MQRRVAVSLRIPGTSPMPELIRLIQDVETAGFDGAGILDSQLLCRDTFVTLGQAATRRSAAASTVPAARSRAATTTGRTAGVSEAAERAPSALPAASNRHSSAPTRRGHPPRR